MHTSESFNYLKSQIEEKSKLNEEIINSIHEWEKKLKMKIDFLVLKLRNEIKLMKKMTFNLNPFFNDLIYYFNFWNLFYDLINVNINNLQKFNGTLGFEEQTKYIINILLKKEFKFENKIGYIDYNYNKEDNNDKTILYQIDDNYALFYKPYSSFLNDNNIENLVLKTIDEEYSIEFKENINSISCSKDKKEVFVCLSEDKKVKILDCNLELLKMKLSKDEIVGKSLNYNDHFNKCIQITNEHFATADNNNISIWSRIIDSIDNKKEYINIFNIILNSSILDLLSINNKYCISCQKNIISFINNYSIEEEKSIFDDRFEFYNSNNCLLLLKDYVAVNCLKGIAFIYLKTKEIVQFIDNKFEKKYICLNNQYSFYIISLFNNKYKENVAIGRFKNYNIKNDQYLYLWGRIEEMKYIDGSFECIENYGQIYSYNSSENLNPFNIIRIKNNFIYSLNKYFLLEEKVLSEVKSYDNQGYKLLLKKNI